MPDIYLNPKVDPLYALMEECDISTDIIDEATDSFIDRVIEKIRAIATKIKEVISTVMSKISQMLNADMAYIKANEKKLDSGFQMIRSSGSKLHIEDMYLPETYSEFSKAASDIKLNKVSLYSVCLDNAVKLCERIKKGEQVKFDPEDKNALYSVVFSTLNPEEEYCDNTIKLPTAIEYGKIREALEASYKKSSSNIEWINPSILRSTASEAVETSKKLNKDLHRVKELCDYCIDHARNVKMKASILSRGEILQAINSCVSKCMTLLKGHNDIVANVISFNGKMISDVRKIYLGVAKLYVKFANTDMIEADKTYTIGKAQEIRESYNYGIFTDISTTY